MEVFGQKYEKNWCGGFFNAKSEEKLETKAVKKIH